jgi:cell division protein FtsZ
MAQPKKKKNIKPKAKKTVKKVVRKVVAVKKSIKKKAPKRIAPKKKSKKSATKKAVAIAEESSFGTSPFRAKIKVVGVGGGGGSIVAEIGKSLERATFTVADTDIRALKKRPGIKYIWFGEKYTRGLGTGLNVALAQQAAEEAKEKMSQVVKDQDIVIFIASLGGGVGSGATEIFAKAVKEFGGITLGIFTLPFKFEGAQKQKTARDALKTLRHLLNVSLVIPNERIFKIIDETTAITDAFSLVNKNLVGSLESLIELISSAGVINIDFADLRTILSGRGATAFLNTAEASGKARAEKICEQILVNPLFQSGSLEAEKILLHIAGAADLSMLEVEKISRHVSELNPKAKVIFGISKNAKLKNKIKATVLITGNQEKEEYVPEKVVPVAEVKEVASAKATAPEVKKEAVKKKEGSSAKASAARRKKKEKKLAIAPVFEPQVATTASTAERKLSVVEHSPKTPIRRNALEIKKEEEQEEKKRREQEQEWEIPAFLRFKK